MYDLKINPKNPQELILGLFYADTAVFRSTNGAESWESFAFGLSPWEVIVQSIAIDTVNDQIYLGVSGPTGMYILDWSTDIQSEGGAGSYFSIEAFPNPFNPSTELRVGLIEPGNITLTVYDLLGREVATVANDFYQAGFHTFTWNAEGFASGIYIARVTINDDFGGVKFAGARKMLLLK